MKVGDLVKARYKTGYLGILMEIKTFYYGRPKEYTVLWNNGRIGYMTESFLEAVKKCP